MDISVLLALDTAAFQQGLKAATDALGQFKAGADVCFEALGKAQAQIDAAAEAAAKEAAKVTEAAEAARAQAEAEKEAAQATREAAEASEKGAGAAKDLDKALQGAKGGLGVVSGASAMASGSLQGMAGGAVQAAGGMKALGLSLRAVEKASVVLALAAATAALAKAMLDARQRAEELSRGIQFGNMRAGAEGAASAFSKLCAEMERAAGLQRSLDDVAGSRRRLEQERQLAELERDRNRELAAGGDELEVNRRYDAQRRRLEFSFRREEAGAEVAGLERDRSANAERRGALGQELERLEGQWREQSGRALAATAAMSGTMWPKRKERYAEEAERWGGAASETVRSMEALRQELSALEAEDAALAERLDVAQGRGGVIDLQEEAAALAAAIPEKAKDEGAGGGGVKDPATRGAGGWGAMQLSSDRLARIGGYVGGSHARQNEGRELLQVEKRKEQLLRQIADNTSKKEEGGLA